MSDQTLLLSLKPGQHDGDGQRLAEAAQRHLGLTTGRVRSLAAYTVRYPLSEAQVLLFQAPRLAVFPGVAIAVAVLGLNLLGDGLRDLLDPRLARAR